MTRPLIDRLITIIEWFVVSRVLRQYGSPQNISEEFTTYAIFWDEESKDGHLESHIP